MEDYRKADLLVLDDVCVQFGTDTEKLLLYDIIDYRYEYNRPTLVTTNGTLNVLKSLIGERCFERLLDNGGKILNFEWSSYRLKRHREQQEE